MRLGAETAPIATWGPEPGGSETDSCINSVVKWDAQGLPGSPRWGSDVTLTRTRSGRPTPANPCSPEKLRRPVDRRNTEQRPKARLLLWSHFLRQSSG